jgi:hypothetical protein
MENNKKAIDLGILTEDEQSGVKRVSLVEEPAIELDFRYFGKQYSFVKPSGGESKDAFISRCIPVLIKEGKPEDQAAAICYSSWEEGFAVDMPHYTEDGVLYEGPTHKDASGRLMTGAVHTADSQYLYHEDEFDIDTAGLAPYVAPYVKKKNGKAEAPVIKAILMQKEWTTDEYLVETVLKLASELGIKEEDLGSLFEQRFAEMITPTTNPATASQAPNKELILYKYMGEAGSNSRDFCRLMVGRDLYYTKESIKAMSSLIANPGFGHNGAAYDLFLYKGGPFCKHWFNDFLVKATGDGKITIQDLGPAVGRAGIKPDNMARNGRYSSAFKFAAEDRMELVGPAMVPDMSIPRLDDDGEKYFVRFSAETIKEICMKYMKEARTNDVNTDHEENSAGAYIYESWIVESTDDKANTLYGYNVPVGTWMITMKVDDKKTWARIKAGELRGFSIEGLLMDLEELEAKKRYEEIIKIMRDK